MLTALEAAPLKIRRATEHFHLVENVIGQYIATKPYKVITEPNGDETVHILKEPPSDIAIIAGEIIYQLRSTLDYLAFDLVKLNPLGITLPRDWEDNCCFPLWLNPPKKTPVYNCFKGRLPGITKAAFAFVERLQPYHRKGAAEIMGLIANLSNIDKHRHLNVTIPNLITAEVLTHTRGTISIRRSGLKHGAKIEPRVMQQPYPTVNVERTSSVYVVFDEPTVGKSAHLAVEDILKLCIEEIENDIIPAFAHFLK